MERPSFVATSTCNNQRDLGTNCFCIVEKKGIQGTSSPNIDTRNAGTGETNQEEPHRGNPRNVQRQNEVAQLEVVPVDSSEVAPQNTQGWVDDKNKLRERFAQFADGRWITLILANREVCTTTNLLKRRRSRTNSDTNERRAKRARVLASLGELSAARQALEGAAVAPGDEITLAALRDRQRRPPIPREPILRASKKGAAAGPFGTTSEHLFPLLRNPRDKELLCQMATEVARANSQPRSST